MNPLGEYRAIHGYIEIVEKKMETLGKKGEGSEGQVKEGGVSGIWPNNGVRSRDPLAHLPSSHLLSLLRKGGLPTFMSSFLGVPMIRII